MQLKIGLLCSGTLGLKTLSKLTDLFIPQFIFTDKNSVEIISFANESNIPVFIGNPIKNDPTEFLRQFDTDIILSINYLFIVNEIVLKHPKYYAINFHGSLLPKYRGRTPHVWAIINGENETGITAHLMADGCDTGDIILQEKLPINHEDTGSTILSKFEILYPKVIYKVLELIKEGRIQTFKQNNDHATYFGKRTPEDGQINWNWHKERIFNWIRAQAFPYPGAYTYINGQKIIIDKISFTDYGYSNDMPNGLILKDSNEMLVKTPNGVIKILTIRENQSEKVKSNNRFESQCK